MIKCKRHLPFPSLAFSSPLFNPCVVLGTQLLSNVGNCNEEQVLYCQYCRDAHASPSGCNS